MLCTAVSSESRAAAAGCSAWRQLTPRIGWLPSKILKPARALAKPLQTTSSDGPANGDSSSNVSSTSRDARRREKTGSKGEKMAGATPKLKLLCLHGYMQNAEIFRNRLGSMRKALKSRVEFVFVDAPFEAQGLPGSSDEPDEAVQGVQGGRSWWQYTDTGPNGRPSRATAYMGWEVAQSSLLAALREHQPDGLLGFSQGATAAALLLSHLAAKAAEEEADSGTSAASTQEASSYRLKCSILVAGFLPRDPAAAALLQDGGRRNTVPLLFVTGTSDTLVPPESTAKLWECFNPPTVSSYTHGGAHLVPTCSGQFKIAMAAFLENVNGPASHRVPPAPLHAAQQEQEAAAHCRVRDC
ncbi:hypothetical protein PLESTB_001773500 [Pleodorina starrii]|uniref:Serine hydrolase domain-containing protein n=1 Tax=Pleodorina starrii TaxID=330485 RepID=A0A9W6F9S9_9CHLO|nr:hypothetical protein PLESTM_000824700 [Pleodorina starrii]GLC61588.1 hypothetical protein PLESTB_001773500 [Pleodorina starrii]GLC76985.1 hypothetical protein PLESTF_001864100 [Pleodorina starrii]